MMLPWQPNFYSVYKKRNEQKWGVSWVLPRIFNVLFLFFVLLFGFFFYLFFFLFFCCFFLHLLKLYF